MLSSYKLILLFVLLDFTTKCFDVVDLITLADGLFSVKGKTRTMPITSHKDSPHASMPLSVLRSFILLLTRVLDNQTCLCWKKIFQAIQCLLWCPRLRSSGARFDTIAVDQFIWASTSPMISYAKLTINGNYLCRSCSSTSSGSGKAKKKTKNNSQKIFNEIPSRQFFSSISCLKVFACQLRQ